MARISVLVPVYNVEAYVAEALASIQSQTFTDIEMVVVDDGSTDGTLRIVKQIASTDSRIRIVRTPRNLGLPRALNLGLTFCQAPFIARMDGDDIALPTRLEKQLRFLEEYPNIALVGCACSPIDQFGSPIPGASISFKPVTQEAITKTMLLSTPCCHVWLARREIYTALSNYRVMPVAEDHDFLLRAVRAGFLLGNLPEALMQIRTRPGQLSSCLQQMKAYYYVVALYRERVKHGEDSFSLANYERATKSGKVEEAFFRIAQRCNRKGFQSCNKFIRFSLAGLSAILSPWQARYFIRRARFNLVWREVMHLS
ncbi:MAG: glycosyltransferase family 2 protein [Terracidiphilus sp.]|jgi:glycosyltransferase involved in cell wall biosynthesis